jgi:GNAT superfamily N-acetyltransferase
MSKITLRWLEVTDLDQLADIDRSERIRTAFELQDGALVGRPVEWDVPSFLKEGHGEHSITEQIRFCQSHLDRGGRLLGAFDAERLVGVGLLTPEIRPGIAQLAFLHVSARYRRSGIAARLVRTLIEWASETGARQLYVSAIPSESAVGFYLAQGFAPAEEPLPELFELEPDDIHLIRDL